MKYQILLQDRITGRQALIKCPVNMVLEQLSAIIKVNLQLPPCDYAYHRFLCNGKTYVVSEHLTSEPEMLWESTGFYDCHYRCSETIRLKHIYTVKGTAMTYLQDSPRHMNQYKVRVTFLGMV